MIRYVFPQTVTKDPNFNRTGGLTVLELVALHFMNDKLPPDLAIPLAFDDAQKFMHEFEKRSSRWTEPEPVYKPTGE